jgi:hypothetical protein
MAKLPPIPADLRVVAIAAVADAGNAGWPVAGCQPEQQAKLAEICLRRWRSFSRRNVSTKERIDQVRDIAHGLIEATGESRAMVGRLKVDYEYLAGQVLSAIELWQSERS